MDFLESILGLLCWIHIHDQEYVWQKAPHKPSLFLLELHSEFCTSSFFVQYLKEMRCCKISFMVKPFALYYKKIYLKMPMSLWKFSYLLLTPHDHIFVQNFLGFKILRCSFKLLFIWHIFHIGKYRLFNTNLLIKLHNWVSKLS